MWRSRWYIITTIVVVPGTSTTYIVCLNRLKDNLVQNSSALYPVTLWLLMKTSPCAVMLVTPTQFRVGETRHQPKPANRLFRFSLWVVVSYPGMIQKGLSTSHVLYFNTSTVLYRRYRGWPPDCVTGVRHLPESGVPQIQWAEYNTGLFFSCIPTSLVSNQQADVGMRYTYIL